MKYKLGGGLKEVHVNLRNITHCICRKCPSYPGMLRELSHAEAPGLYCAHGKSRLDIEKKGCICADCVVHKEHFLDSGYYCARAK